MWIYSWIHPIISLHCAFTPTNPALIRANLAKLSAIASEVLGSLVSSSTTFCCVSKTLFYYFLYKNKEHVLSHASPGVRNKKTKRVGSQKNYTDLPRETLLMTTTHTLSDPIAVNSASFARINAGFVGVNAQRRDMIGWIQLYPHPYARIDKKNVGANRNDA